MRVDRSYHYKVEVNVQVDESQPTLLNSNSEVSIRVWRKVLCPPNTLDALHDEPEQSSRLRDAKWGFQSKWHHCEEAQKKERKFTNCCDDIV